jgi:hypothetical protein
MRTARDRCCKEPFVFDGDDGALCRIAHFDKCVWYQYQIYIPVVLAVSLAARKAWLDQAADDLKPAAVTRQ